MQLALASPWQNGRVAGQTGQLGKYRSSFYRERLLFPLQIKHRPGKVLWRLRRTRNDDHVLGEIVVVAGLKRVDLLGTDFSCAGLTPIA